ncbi:hypothetical protein LEMLEM_LOCUS22477 [Lemmus lemmus]
MPLLQSTKFWDYKQLKKAVDISIHETALLLMVYETNLQ